MEAASLQACAWQILAAVPFETAATSRVFSWMLKLLAVRSHSQLPMRICKMVIAVMESTSTKEKVRHMPCRMQYTVHELFAERHHSS